MGDIHVALYAAAPAKPALGARCNGCGACCTAEPCPVSRLLLAHRHGACPALLWDAAGCNYRCGMATQPHQYLSWLPARTSTLAAAAFRRWIAAGVGCDFDAEVR